MHSCKQVEPQKETWTERTEGQEKRMDYLMEISDNERLGTCGTKSSHKIHRRKPWRPA